MNWGVQFDEVTSDSSNSQYGLWIIFLFFFKDEKSVYYISMLFCYNSLCGFFYNASATKLICLLRISFLFTLNKHEFQMRRGLLYFRWRLLRCFLMSIQQNLLNIMVILMLFRNCNSNFKCIEYIFSKKKESPLLGIKIG